MAANTSPIFGLVARVAGTPFTSADTTSKKTLFTPGTNGSRIEGVAVSTNDTATVNLAFYANDGSTDYYLGNVVVAAGSGYTTVVRVDALATIAAPGTGVLVFPSGTTLKANCVATMTAAKTTDIVVMGADF